MDDTASHPLAGLISIHDVMPETLHEVERLLARLREWGADPVTLLVVPGAGWTDETLARLRTLPDEDTRLAGHGWRHRVERRRGLYHHLHGLLLSRHVAEHLALDGDGIAALMTRCRRWFADRDLPVPDLYVPPAWALGRIDRTRLASLPFRQVELFRGVFHAATRHTTPLPLTGYEADAAARAPLLRAWNALNLRRATRTGRPLRIGIHPYDLHYPLAPDLEQHVRACTRCLRYDQLPSTPDPRKGPS